MQVASPHTGRVRSAVVGRRLDCADCSRLYRGHERHKAQHSEGERRETQNLFHNSYYALSISRRYGASAGRSVSDALTIGFWWWSFIPGSGSLMRNHAT